MLRPLHAAVSSALVLAAAVAAPLAAGSFGTAPQPSVTIDSFAGTFTLSTPTSYGTLVISGSAASDGLVASASLDGNATSFGVLIEKDAAGAVTLTNGFDAHGSVVRSVDGVAGAQQVVSSSVSSKQAVETDAVYLAAAEAQGLLEAGAYDPLLDDEQSGFTALSFLYDAVIGGGDDGGVFTPATSYPTTLQPKDCLIIASIQYGYCLDSCGANFFCYYGCLEAAGETYRDCMFDIQLSGK